MHINILLDEGSVRIIGTDPFLLMGDSKSVFTSISHGPDIAADTSEIFVNGNCTEGCVK
jgi:hypothetical protein